MSEVATRGRRLPIQYERAQSAQRRLVELRRAGRIPDILWLLEHPPTITWGSTGGREHLLATEASLAARGIDLAASERGGDVTYHEPGQLVGYLVVDLRDPQARDLHAFLRGVEAGLIATLARAGIPSQRIDGRTGVWVGTGLARKVAAIGVRAKGWITSHGFALNVNNALEGFGLIVPCGIPGAGVTSIERELGEERAPSWDDLVRTLHAELEASLARPLRLMRGDEALEAAAD